MVVIVGIMVITVMVMVMFTEIRQSRDLRPQQAWHSEKQGQVATSISTSISSITVPSNQKRAIYRTIEYKMFFREYHHVCGVIIRVYINIDIIMCVEWVHQYGYHHVCGVGASI